MSDYMRKVFYVRKREENPDCSVTAGYVKAERRKQVLTLTIFLDTQDLPEECPVCAVYCTGREWQCFSCGWVTFDKNGTTVCNLFLPDDETALRFVRAMKGERLPGVPHFTHTPASLEFFNQRALDMVMAYKQESPAFQQLQALPEDYVCAVYVEFNLMHENRFLPILRELEQVVRAVGGDPERTWVARDSRELEKLLFFRHTVPEVTDIIVERNKKKEPCITILSTDMAVDDAHFDELFHIYQHDLSQTDLDWVIFGHIGENHVHPNIFARDRAEYEFGLRLFEKWAADVHRMDGTITGEHGTGKIKKKLAYIMYGPEKMAKLWQLKRTLDPKGLLGPGNILTEVEA